MSHVLFWDIDGTLLTTGRAGIFAWEAAAEEVCGRHIDLSALPTGGLTDAQIAALVVREAGAEASPERSTAALRSYERHLPERLPWRQGAVLPGVVGILEHLATRDDVSCLLLTGNTSQGAAAKLRHYGLDRYFTSGGGFCRDGSDRISIAREACDLAQVSGHSSQDGVFVIGDTPHDVRCGQAVGARTVGVASGDYDAGELRETGAWLVLERLPEPPEFMAMLGLEQRRR